MASSRLPITNTANKVLEQNTGAPSEENEWAPLPRNLAEAETGLQLFQRAPMRGPHYRLERNVVNMTQRYTPPDLIVVSALSASNSSPGAKD